MPGQLPTPRRAVILYAQALAVLGAAVVARWALTPFIGDALPFVTLFGAVAAAVWIGGYRPALVVTFLGYLAANLLFILPAGSISFEADDAVGFAAYMFTCGLIIALGESMRAERVRAAAQKETLRVTLRSIGDAVITTDTDERVTSLNDVAESLTGWTAADAIGQPLSAVFPIVNEHSRKPVESPAARALEQGAIVGLANHTVLVRRDGVEVPIEDSAAPIRDERGAVSGCVLTFRDVTDQRQIERDKALQLVSARFLAAIVESSDDAIISKSLDGTIQSWNAGAERVFGHTAADAIGRHISLIIPPERLSEEDTIIASLKAGQRIDHFETERVRSDGRRIVVSLTISPMKDETGTVVGASKIVRDVTYQRETERRERHALAEARKFIALIETSTDFIGICDLKGVPFFVNRAGLAMVGLDSLEQATRVSLADFFFPEDQERVAREFLPAVLQQGHGEVEIRFRHFKTSEARWMAYKVLALADDTGAPIAFATVSQDVTERKRLEDSLRTLAANLSEADRRKNEFLAMLAHELRNPLAPISNATQALRLGGGDAATIHSAAGMLERQVRLMSRLVDDLLDMSRITRGRIELRRERVDLVPLVHHAVDAVDGLYQGASQRLDVTVPSEPVYLDADPARLTQVVGNLLNNASKFTDRGGHVALEVGLDGSDAVIRVKDNGIGIAPDELPRVFDMFAQVDTSLERSRDGLGIGLTLVRTLVEMHGGTVEARSLGIGRGSEFIIRLPRLVEGSIIVTPSPIEPLTPSAGQRVLIVDDNVDGAESLSMLLRLGGHDTHQAHDGLEAIEIAEAIRPHAILLDIGLPSLNGYEVCRRLREQPWGKHVLLIALTGWGQEEDRHRTSDAGFDAHLVKPVDHDALLALLAAPVSSERVGVPS